MIKIMLLGNQGQLGWELERTLAPLGTVLALDYPEIDLTAPDHLLRTIRETMPAVIVNATAYTAVDRAEDEPEIAHQVNGAAPGLLAELAREIKAALVHFSTDYVFSGETDRPYVESDAPAPLNEYGRSKLAGEQAVTAVDGAYLILRTSWVYSLRRPSFVTKVLEWARKNPELKIVSDQVGNPTWARMLAETTALLLARSGQHPAGWIAERRGLYHLAGSGYASRLEWAAAILRLDPRPEEQIAGQVLPARTADFPTPARRPLFSALDCTHFEDTFSLSLPSWIESLHWVMLP